MAGHIPPAGDMQSPGQGVGSSLSTPKFEKGSEYTNWC